MREERLALEPRRLPKEVDIEIVNKMISLFYMHYVSQEQSDIHNILSISTSSPCSPCIPFFLGALIGFMRVGACITSMPQNKVLKGASAFDVNFSSIEVALQSQL